MALSAAISFRSWLRSGAGKRRLEPDGITQVFQLPALGSTYPVLAPCAQTNAPIPTTITIKPIPMPTLFMPSSTVFSPYLTGRCRVARYSDRYAKTDRSVARQRDENANCETA
jgi:hypothetical protein